MDIAQVYIISIAFWISGVILCASEDKKEKFWLRILGIILISAAIMAVFRFIKIESLSGEMFLRIFAITVMVLFLLSAWKVSLSVAIYDTIWGILVWQIISELWNLSYILRENMFGSESIYSNILCVLVFAVGYGICMVTIGKWITKSQKKKIGPRQTFSAILIFAIVEILSFSPTFRSTETFDGEWRFLFVSQIMCVVILYMQNELFKKSEMKQELEVMNLLWEKEQERYQISKENIELLNQKSHDLKHQIRALRQVKKEEFDECLDEMEDNVNIYEAITKTGNPVLDTILTEKSLYCKDHEIKVSCVVDGGQMEFIGTVDLYVILGNAMDNAIEAVKKFKETEKRQIDVIIYRQHSFLIMNIINPVYEPLVYDGGIYDGEIPVTTKGDKRFHGFGLRSIWHIVKKYDGYIDISEEDGCFSLKILIPIPNEENRNGQYWL